MGLTSTDNGFWEKSDRHYTRREADAFRRERNRELDKAETAQYRSTVKDLGKQAREARAKRVEQRKEAKGVCHTNLTNTKEANKDKRPQRRRAETAKVRAECDFVVANIEEETAQKLEQIEGAREKEDGYRRSSRIARRHNRERETERKKRVSPKERREEALDTIRNGLEPEMLPYFEEIKDSPGFKKLLAAGRMTGIEAVLQMAHESPEDVFAALEREVERELRREIERFENEGGRLAKGEPGAMLNESAQPSDDTTAEPSSEEASNDGPPAKKRGRPRGSRNASRTEKAPARRKRATKEDAAAKEDAATPKERVHAHHSDADDHAREVERFEHEGGRVHEDPEEEPPPSDPKPQHRGSHARTDHETSHTHHGAAHAHTQHGAAHGHHEQEASTQRNGVASPAACACKVPSGAQKPATPHNEVAHTERPPASHAAPAEPARSAEEPNPHRRLSAVERTAWMPGTEPAQRPREEPTPPARRGLFGEEEDTLPETPDAKEQKGERPQPKRTDPDTQQAFGTSFSNWLAQAGPQLSLDSAPVRPSSEPAKKLASTHHDAAPARHESTSREPIALQPRTPPDERVYIGNETPVPGQPRFSLQQFEDAMLYIDHGTEVLQIRFPERPSKEIRAALEGGGFKWYPYIERWQGPLDDTHRMVADAALTFYAHHAAAARVQATTLHSATPPAPAAAQPPAKHVTTIASARAELADRAHAAPAEPTVTQERPKLTTRGFAGGQLYVDHDKHLVQVAFEEMPEHIIRTVLRQRGFRWLSGLQRWQAPLEDATLQTAETALTEHANHMEARLARRGGRKPVSEQPQEYAGAEEALNEAQPSEEVAEPPEDEPEPNTYERKRAARAERLHARADALQAEANATYASAKQKADRIPFGQPILVGHHSEGRDRRFRGRIDAQMEQSFELQAKAREVERRAKLAENSDIISSDDPDAIKKLEAKIAEIEQRMQRADDINRVIRAARSRNKTGWEPIAQQQLIALGLTSEAAAKFTRPDFAGRFGVTGHARRNARGEINRLQHRIEELKSRDARPVGAPVRIGEAVVTENREANRVQIRFDGIPPKEARTRLRGRGFVWAPSVGVWQRKLNDNATWAAKQILRDLYGPNAGQKPAGPTPAAASEREPMRQPGDDADEDDAPSNSGHRNESEGGAEPPPF